MRSARLAGVLCLLVAASACGVSGDAPLLGGNPSNGIVKVSVVDVFSGQFGSAGQNLINGLQVEADQLNALGGLLGYRVEVVAADDESDANKGTELVREQISDPQVKLLVGPNDTEVFLPSKSLITRALIPNCLSTGVTDADVTGAPTTFRTQGRDQDRVAALMRYLQTNRPTVKKVALLSDNDVTGHGLDSLISSLSSGPLKTAGITYGGAAFTPVTAATDIPSGPDVVIPFVRQLVDAGAQAIFLSEETPLAALTAQAVDQLGLTGKVLLLGVGGVDSYEYPFTGGAAAVGTYFGSTNLSYLTSLPQSQWPPAYRDFVKAIVSRYGYAPNGVEMRGNPTGADCLVQWAKAVRAAGTFDGPSVEKAWEGIQVSPAESPLGVQETPRSHESVPAGGIFVYQWVRQGNRFQLKQLG
jgi:branched-chain amino acid transport system substrate-binding protein